MVVQGHRHASAKVVDERGYQPFAYVYQGANDEVHAHRQ